MALDKKALRKFSPKERLRKLKEIEKEARKEIVEAEELIQITEKESVELPDIEIPKIEPVDITKLFEPLHGLESAVRDEPSTENQSPVRYISSEYSPAVMVHYGASDMQVKHDLFVKFEDTVIYRSEADKISHGAASRSVLDSLKKYTKG